MKYILSFFALVLSLSAYGTYLNFDNQPTVAFHIDLVSEASGGALGLSVNQTMKEKIDFDLTLFSNDEAQIIIRTLDRTEYRDGNFLAKLFGNMEPKKFRSELLKQACEKLINTPLHFKRNSEGKMVETTGLLAEVENQLALFEYELLGASSKDFDEFFTVLLHLNGKDLQSEQSYSAQTDTVDCNYLITKADDHSIHGTFQGQKVSSEESFDVQGVVTWDSHCSLVQQRTAKATLKKTIQEEHGPIDMEAVCMEIWKSHVK